MAVSLACLPSSSAGRALGCLTPCTWQWHPPMQSRDSRFQPHTLWGAVLGVERGSPHPCHPQAHLLLGQGQPGSIPALLGIPQAGPSPSLGVSVPVCETNESPTCCWPGLAAVRVLLQASAPGPSSRSPPGSTSHTLPTHQPWELVLLSCLSTCYVPSTVENFTPV